MKCPRCQLENPSHTKFCLEYGVRVDEAATPSFVADLKAEVAELKAEVEGLKSRPGGDGLPLARVNPHPISDIDGIGVYWRKS
jgi:hypothetical protein